MVQVAETLKGLPLFERLPDETITILHERMEAVFLDTREVLFHKGDPSGMMYLIEEGQVEIIGEENGQRRVLNICNPGYALGAMSLMDEQPRTASVESTMPTTLLTLSRKDFLDVVSDLPEELQEWLRDVAANLRAGFADILERIPLFEDLPHNVLEMLAGKMEGDSINEGEVLFKKGAPGNLLYLVDEGWIKIVTEDSRGEELVLNRCGPGEAIGEMSLLDEQPRSASAVALSPSKVFKLTREDFFTVMADYPSLAQHLLRKLSLRMRFATTYIEQAIQYARNIAEGDYHFVMKQIEDNQLQITPQESDEARASELLTAFFQMVQDVQAREEELKKEVRRLKIEIDQAKRTEQYEEITTSDGFQDLVAQARKLKAERDLEDDNSGD